MSELGGQAQQIAATGSDANRQYNLILDRLKAASVLQIRDGSRRGVGLEPEEQGVWVQRDCRR